LVAVMVPTVAYGPMIVKQFFAPVLWAEDESSRLLSFAIR
jgi:hypothetical protein